MILDRRTVANSVDEGGSGCGECRRSSTTRGRRRPARRSLLPDWGRRRSFLLPLTALIRLPTVFIRWTAPRRVPPAIQSPAMASFGARSRQTSDSDAFAARRRLRRRELVDGTAAHAAWARRDRDRNKCVGIGDGLLLPAVRLLVSRPKGPRPGRLDSTICRFATRV